MVVAVNNRPDTSAVQTQAKPKVIHRMRRIRLGVGGGAFGGTGWTDPWATRAIPRGFPTVRGEGLPKKSSWLPGSVSNSSSPARRTSSDGGITGPDVGTAGAGVRGWSTTGPGGGSWASVRPSRTSAVALPWENHRASWTPNGSANQPWGGFSGLPTSPSMPRE